jgi:predicted nuclease of predicted toxin-antitoxin system
MGRFLIDEDLPPILGVLLRQKGHETAHVIDLGLRGLPDGGVFELAQTRKATLLSRDLGFANTLQYPPGSHHGIVVVRFPTETRRNALITEVITRLAAVRDDEFKGALIVVEPGRIRIRRST